ncbi:hypothetical protein LOD99_4917 [Oopsacas minuta]|uniref:Uncharacterized protein n=1 Tax=Oopsacas minuta TaxID=111878 RepID=A0AAV7JT77_9METZ|nr:hypothetical protein LOD99_4917 [Oopsacas minuta]
MCRIASIVILCIHASLNIILILIRGAIIGFCIFSIHHLAKSAQELPTDSPTELTTEPSVTDSYTCQLVSIIIALFLMILSSITEIIQVIFSSLVLHQICIEDRKQRCCRIQMKGDYLKMDTTGEAL